jgi:hypothetical protein
MDTSNDVTHKHAKKLLWNSLYLWLHKNNKSVKN